MNKTTPERQLDCIMAVLCNYAAIAFGIGVFEGKPDGLISGMVAIVCAFFLTTFYED